MRVALVVTGRLEFRGLAGALQRLFLGTEFFIAPSLVEVELYDSTSARVDPARNAKNVAQGNTPKIDELIGHLAGNLAAVGECPRHRRPKDRRCPWGGDGRREHPKKYLKYLCRETPPNEFCSTYLETSGGADALAQLDWNVVLATPGSAPCLRALVEDLAEALGQPPEIHGWSDAPTSEAPTALFRAPRARVLRNL